MDIVVIQTLSHSHLIIHQSPLNPKNLVPQEKIKITVPILLLNKLLLLNRVVIYGQNNEHICDEMKVHIVSHQKKHEFVNFIKKVFQPYDQIQKSD